MQKSTEAQLDEKVVGKVDTPVPGTVHTILSEALNPRAVKRNQ